ncbi:MAG: sulfotransferase [Candidatus Melainabacteria bacterium]|nr:sulfotransferase [Candidatus Melainabacteria bacterium]
MPKKKIKVLNIVGWGRSGSTVLGNVLGEIDGFFFGGEIRNVWNRVLIENRQCGCTKPIKECDFWSKVFDDAFGGFEVVDPKAMQVLLKSYTRTRHLPLLFLPNSKKYFKNKLNEYLANLEKLFQSISDISGSRVIIDSSKSASYSLMLSLIDNIDLHVIHLIRDSRGVAYSRLKTKFHQEDKQVIEMKKMSSFNNSIMWDVRNFATELLWHKFPERYIRIKYEDFASMPEEVLKTILEAVGEESKHLPFVSKNTVKLNANHAVWGNPSRFQTGLVELKLDEEWKRKMHMRDKIIATMLTWPLLLKYGYC